MDTAFWTVHATANGTVAVVEQLSRQAGECSTLLGLEHKVGHRGTVLPEVDDEMLARPHHHLTVLILTDDSHLAIGRVGLAGHVFPDIRPVWRQREVVAQIYLRAV